MCKEVEKEPSKYLYRHYTEKCDVCFNLVDKYEETDELSEEWRRWYKKQDDMVMWLINEVKNDMSRRPKNECDNRYVTRGVPATTKVLCERCTRLQNENRRY